MFKLDHIFVRLSRNAEKLRHSSSREASEADLKTRAKISSYFANKWFAATLPNVLLLLVHFHFKQHLGEKKEKEESLSTIWWHFFKFYDCHNDQNSMMKDDVAKRGVKLNKICFWHFAAKFFSRHEVYKTSNVIQILSERCYVSCLWIATKSLSRKTRKTTVTAPGHSWGSPQVLSSWKQKQVGISLRNFSIDTDATFQIDTKRLYLFWAVWPKTKEKLTS